MAVLNEKSDSLIVSECFYSIQGEGATMGTPAVFLRLAGCNLLCKSEHWICDSIEVWRQGTKLPFSEVLSVDKIDHLLTGAHLVITGGEPLLHQSNLVKYIEWLEEKYNQRFIIEIETNGTILPLDSLIKKVSYWNVSPKLPNSGESIKRRLNPLAITKLNSIKNASVIFKFVIDQDEDFIDILTEYGDWIDMKKVYLMPAGDTQELLNKSRPIVVDLAKRMTLKYSERLHIVIWNKKTGV